MLDSNTLNHLCEYLKPVKCVNKLALTHPKIKLTTNCYSLTNHMYNHLTVCKQIIDTKMNY